MQGLGSASLGQLQTWWNGREIATEELLSNSSSVKGGGLLQEAFSHVALVT